MTVDLVRAQRANSRNAFLAGFLGWTFDAFDFFILTYVLAQVAAEGKDRSDALSSAKKAFDDAQAGREKSPNLEQVNRLSRMLSASATTQSAK